MDRRQARKIGYLALGDIASDLATGREFDLDEVLEAYGVSEAVDVSKVKNALRGIGISLRERGRNMKATGGGGVFNFASTPVQGVNNLFNGQTQPVATPVQTNVTTRTSISTLILSTLVEGEIENRTQAGDSFTAYDITTALRTANPTLEINHSEVRPIVRDIMNGVNNYFGDYRDFGNGTIAWEYRQVPVAGFVANTMPQIPVGLSTTQPGGLTFLAFNLNNGK